MDFPFYYKINRPQFSYSPDGAKTSVDRLRGLLSHGPLRKARVDEPKILFIFTEQDRDHANQLFLALKNGIGTFPGCKSLINLKVSLENIEGLVVKDVDQNVQGQVFFEALTKRLESGKEKPDVAFIIYSREVGFLADDPYERCKVVLIAHGIPSQYVSRDLLDSVTQFRFAMSNIALNLLVKLGGIPWSINLSYKQPTLVLGIGSRRLVNLEKKSTEWLGFSVNLLSNGFFIDTQFFPPATVYSEFLVSIDRGLTDALNNLLREYGDVRKVTVHVSHFEKYSTVRKISDVISTFGKKQNVTIPFEVVRFTVDSAFGVFDLAQPSYVSEEGIVVGLDRKHALLVTEGIKEKEVWRGRKPAVLEMRREFSTSKDISFRETIEDAFNLCAVNWRGFNAITQPVSIRYSKLLAEHVAKLSFFDPDIKDKIVGHDAFKGVPWFL